VALFYRISSEEEWRAARSDGMFRGAAHDLRDGFVHLSAPHQVEGTLAAHYAGAPDLVLLAIDGAALDAAGSVKWEPSRGGELFPHLHGALPVALVTRVIPLPLDASGKHVLPAELTRDSIGYGGSHSS
jgi:uncharacterized protein (DUF952 family)